MQPASRRATWCTLLCVLLLGVFLLRAETGDGGPPRPEAAASARPEAAAALPAAPGPLPHSPPRRLAVPSIGVDAPLTGVGLEQDGSIEAPPLADDNLAGWYTGAAAPGGRGTSVVVGHVDNDRGPAVFYPLGTLKRDSRIEVLREDGSTAVFSVYGVEMYPRTDFPADRVYRDGPRPELRLITCGGTYSKKAGYDGNVVVFARLVEVR
ncbi:class F sortase [Streptomyces sp. NPDC004609]|uniref:class F sortase n=1 Tax=Streptomyces sp. NPDC004609 TaxID=3364704 RepID=UPI00368927F1